MKKHRKWKTGEFNWMIGKIKDREAINEKVKHQTIARKILFWNNTASKKPLFNPDLVVQFLEGKTFHQAELRPSISELKSISVHELIKIMSNSSSWVDKGHE